MKRARYQSLTIKRKLEIIDKVESLPPGKKKHCGRVRHSAEYPQQNKDKLQAKHAIGSNTKKRHRDPTHLEVDTSLFQWFTAARLQSIPISGELLRQKRKSLVGSSSLRQVQSHGLVPVGRSPDGRCSTTLSSEVFVARMLQLIKKFAMTGSKGNFYQSYEGLIPAIFSMSTKRGCIGACFQIKPMPSQKCAQEERKVRRESQC